MNFLLSKGSRTELVSILGNIVKQGNNAISPIRTEGSMGGYAYVSIVAADLESIVKDIERYLGG